MHYEQVVVRLATSAIPPDAVKSVILVAKETPVASPRRAAAAVEDAVMQGTRFENLPVLDDFLILIYWMQILLCPG